MTTRRELLASIPATGAAFAVGSGVLFEDSPAQAQEAPPLAGHFHPKGKAPWYNATGIGMYVSGMMIAAFALRSIGDMP